MDTFVWMKNILLIIGLILSNFSLHSQSDSVRNYTIGFSYAGGYIINHSPTIGYVANRHITATEVFFEHNTYGHKVWHERYNFLKMGLMFRSYQLNNEEHLGDAFAVAPYFKFNVLKKRIFQLRFKTSIGLGYIEKTFDVEENYKNVAIGSHINMFLSVLMESSIRINPRLSWNLGVGLDHLSNTGFKTPNLGINMPLINSGLSYDIGKTNSYQKHNENAFQRSGAYWQLTGGFGFDENYPPNGNKFIAGALSITREKRMNYKSSIGYGLDFFYNPAQKEIIEIESGPISASENIQIGASVLHLLHFGKLIFTSQLSVYLKNKNKDLGSIYHVFGGRYPITDKVNAFFYGKTHITRAEYIIMGLGYRLGK